MTRYHIENTQDGPCYHPLTTAEVIDLLETARAFKDHVSFNPGKSTQSIASIQVRLGQGIPGLECPYQIEGPVAEKHNALDQAFVEWIQDPMTLFLKEQPLTENSEIVMKLTNLMKES